jgi:2-polyprenyl-3-methyl-5-hydroxy-6-metoxy-1,4-benzoquinol methylase
MVSLNRHFASEKQTLEFCNNNYSYQEQKSTDCIARFQSIMDLNHNHKILEIGAAQGSMVIAFTRLGYDCVGIEPSAEAIKVSRDMVKIHHTDISMTRGIAESLPFKDEQFDYIIALSVMEHVADPKSVFSEVFRILKPGGAFYFSTTSCLCPWQGEIGLFPCFSWYPNRLKRKIMMWAMQQHPRLIGYTDTPAVNWFTPGGVRRTLQKVGFSKIYETWDVLFPSTSPYLKKKLVRTALRIIRLNTINRRVADVFIPAGTHAIAVK